MLYFSTGLRNKLAGMKAELKAFKSGVNLAYVDGAGSDDTITSSDNDFISLGFAPGDLIYTKNPTTGTNAIAGVACTAVVAGTITFPTGTIGGNTSEAFPAAGCILAVKGGSLKDVLKDGVVNVYTGSPPSDADQPVTGSLLCTLTVSSGAFSAGAFANGLELGDAASGVVAKAAGEVWSGVGLLSPSGVAAYFRWVGNATDAGGSSTTLPRIQGTCGVGTSYDLNMTSTTLASGATLTIDTWQMTFPAYRA